MQTQRQNALFMEQIATMQAQRFGRKTERLECLGQGNIFNGNCSAPASLGC